MALVEFIKGSPTVLTTVDAVLAYGNQTVEISRDDALWRGIGVTKRFGLAASEGLYATLQALDMHLMAASFVEPGIQLSDPLTQFQLPQIAAGLRSLNNPAKSALADVCDALQAIGITYGTRWAASGLSVPSPEEITAALDKIKVLDWMSNVEMLFVQYRVQNVSIAQIKTAVAAFEG
jgi:hypothetical protein